MNRSTTVRRWGALVSAAVAASLLVVVPVGAPAGAAQGGPDAFGYGYIDDAEPGGPAFSYNDISGTGTQVTSGDDSSTTVALPFPVALYGSTVNTLGVSTNGVVSTNINSSFSNGCLPTGTFGGDSILVLWDDLITTVRTQTVGTAPNREFIVQWNGGYFGSGGTVNFNITFTEGSANFEARYQTVGQGGAGSTVGMQSNGGADAFLQYSCNQAGSVPSGRAIDFNFVGQQTEDRVVSVSAQAPTAEEGGEPGVVRFSRTGDRFSTFTVVYSVSGTATSGEDFEPMSGTINFPYGATFVDLPVTALTDQVVDPDETVTVNVEFGDYDRAPQQSTATVVITEATEPVCSGVQEAPFTDVPENYEHAGNIDCIAAYGLAEGYPDGTYRFRENVKRAQMASFVARLLDAAGVALPASPADAFTADDGGVHELAIDQLAALGIFDGTTGEDGEQFFPWEPMRRDDMAQILFNAYKVATGDELPAGGDAFTDDEGTDADGTGTDNEAAINALAAVDVVRGVGGGLYDPDGPVIRGQFASFFARYMQVLADAGVTFARP